MACAWRGIAGARLSRGLSPWCGARIRTSPLRRRGSSIVELVGCGWGGAAGDDDCRAMLALAARRWDRLRLSAGSAAAARRLVRRAVEAAVSRDQVAELSFPGGDGEPAAVVSGAALDRWFAADVVAVAAAAAAAADPKPKPKPSRPDQGPGMGM